MPFSELYRMDKGKLEFESSQDKITKCSNDPSFVPELVWEKGQISMQGQSKARDHNRKNDEMVPWLNYPIPIDHQSLKHGYCSELSGVTVNELSNHNHFSSIRSNTTSVTVKNGVSTSNQGNVPKVSMPSSSSHQCLTSLLSPRSKVSESICNITTKQDLLPPITSSVVMNFSHFSRPAALVQANLRSLGVERTGHKDKVSATNGTNPAESTLFHSSNGLRKETSPAFQPPTAPQKAGSREEPVATKQSEFGPQENTLKDYKDSNQYVESSIRGPLGGEKAKEPVVVCSSVCSGNSIGRPSDDGTNNSKRKFCDTEDSEFPSEEAEEESVDVNRAAYARAGTSSKRSRVPEVHNLSERRRRDRINEKMRVLQELIPNCNKVDKASMLDEAIEYLKTLQLQIQMMSVGAGMYMPPMMLPQQLHMGHFSPMVGMGMGMLYGMGMPDMNIGCSSRPMIQMQGPHFPIHGMPGSNHQLLEPSSTQLLPMSMPLSIPSHMQCQVKHNNVQLADHVNANKAVNAAD